jgi:peroxin-11B
VRLLLLPSLKALLNISYSARVALRDQLSMDVLDIWIPATGAGLVNVNEGVLGVFG